MALSDDELANELRVFARRFMATCTFEKATEMLASSENIHEYYEELPNNRYFEVEAITLYQDADEYGDYFCMLFSVMDDRLRGKLGSVYQPLCCQAYIYSNGRLEFGALGNLATGNQSRDF
jgi:hypothetical protein